MDITNCPMGVYTRENEGEEYRRYMEFIRDLKHSSSNMKDIIDFLLSHDFETLLGISVDKRNENEIKQYSDCLLSTITFPKGDNQSIQEFKRK